MTEHLTDEPLKDLQILRAQVARLQQQEAAWRRAEELLKQSEGRQEARTQELSRKNDELQQEIVERRQAEAQLQEKTQFLRQMLKAYERDRQLIAYEIHDTFVQDVIGALLFADAFEAKHGVAGDPEWEQFAEARKLLRKAIDEARRWISGMRPPIIDEQGIVAAIDYLIGELKQRGPDFQFDHRMNVKRLPPLVEATIFRIVQEALTNIERHSRSDSAHVKLDQGDGTIRLEIRDFGVGFDPDNVTAGHFGLQGIMERARLIGGTISIQSAPGAGTRLVVELPMPESDSVFD